MFKYIRKYKHKQGFTLIELLVVIVVLAILVLLAAPRFTGYTQKAELARIQNDVRVVESKVGEYLIEHGDLTKWGAPIGALDGDELYNKRGLIDSDNPITEGPFRVVPEEVLEEVKSHLDGAFYSNDLGEAYYSKDEFIVDNEDVDEDDGQEPSEKPIPDYYVQATNTDFTKDTIGNWRYTGSDDYVIIPHEIEGEPVTSYRHMFRGSTINGVAASHPVKGVVSTNPNVTNMERMFYQSQTTSLDLSSFDTSKVRNMSGMFNDSAATNLNLSSFNTANVTDMLSMFSGSKATVLDLSSFDTSNVTNMYYMFQDSQAATLDLSNFNTSKVTNMGEMFRNSQATTLDLSSFDTSKLTNMERMFEGSQATSLDLSSFDTANVTTMYAMFRDSQATTLDLSSFNTAKVTTMYAMFRDSQATTLDLSSFDTSNVKNMNSMFNGSPATTGYARTQSEAAKFNKSSSKPSGLTFTVK